MKTLIKWVREVEKMAKETYLQAALVFADDPQFRSFFENIAKEEAWHYQVVGNAEEYFSSKQAPIPAISIDKETRDRIRTLFSDIRRQLKSKTILKEELAEKIVEIEFSEWNDIFLYVVNILKLNNGDFINPASKIQAHLDGIVSFLEKTSPHKDKLLSKLKDLPSVWTENILIVDDEEMITTLIKSLLNRHGNIDVAQNGELALNLIEEKYYKLIISDIKMPIMDGISFFNKAVEKQPSIKKRFLFMSGGLTSQMKAFLDENNLLYLQKPMKIKELRDLASKIILSK